MSSLVGAGETEGKVKMKYSLTIKAVTLTTNEEKIIITNLKKFATKFHNFAEDIPELAIMIKKHDKNHFISGSITLTLPKKKLITKLNGHEVAIVLHEGFETLNKEFETYKAKHFKGSSKHPSNTSIRQKKLDIESIY